MSIITDNTVLVHIYSGLESKNKITLGLLVALTAEKNDHKVTLFLAGDGVHILNCKKAGEIVGQGTGDLYEHLENLKNSKVKIYVSGVSAKSRGYDEKSWKDLMQSLRCPMYLLMSQSKRIASFTVNSLLKKNF